MINKMSSCNCGLNQSGIPKPSEEKRYTPLSGAYDTLKVSMNRKVSTMEYFLMIIIIMILFTLIKDYKWC